MTAHAVRETRSSATRRAGDAVSLAVNAVLLVGVNVWPGWEIIPFLTADMNRVLTAVNVVLVAAIVVGAVNLVADRPGLRTPGELVTTATSFAALVQLVSVFPFDFPDTGFAWTTLVRVLLILAAVGTGAALLVTVLKFIRFLPHWTIGGDASSGPDRRDTTSPQHHVRQ